MMKVHAAKIIHTDNMGREVAGRGYPLLIVQSDIGELKMGMDQMPLARGYAVVMVLNENKGLRRFLLGPDAKVDRPLQQPLTVENATDDPVFVALAREFFDRIDRGETPCILSVSTR